MPWRPFDTAPKHPADEYGRGPRILAMCERGEAVVYWQHWVHSEIKGWWVDPAIVPSVPKNPTEWMPLPEGTEEKGL